MPIQKVTARIVGRAGTWARPLQSGI
jgi:hypothetical protein